MLKRIIAGALLASSMLLGVAPAQAAFGSGSRTTSATIDGTRFTIYTYKPSCSNLQGIAFIHHGTSRDADGYRDSAITLAKAECVVIVAPLFDEDRFPSDDYQRGGVEDDGELRPEGEWTTRYMRGLIEWARGQYGDANASYALFGHSAGGQFLSRVAGYEATDNGLPAGLERIVIANPSTHVRASGVDEADGAPVDINVSYDAIPYGFEDFKAPLANLKKYLALPVTIYLGSDDTQRDSDLATGTYADAQGRNRRARGEFVFNEAKANAQKLGVPFNWKLVYASGCGHSAGCMLRNSNADNAFGLE